VEKTRLSLGLAKRLVQVNLDVAHQIATPAFFSTLSICIVFVPVVFLTGPAAYLFTPLALAVVFAMLASYLLSRTLVPTMVLYLLPAEVHLYADGEHVESAGGGPIWRVHQAFNRQFERLRSTYQRILDWALDHRALTVAVMLGFAMASLGLFPRTGRDFFPSVDAGQFRLHVRAPAGTRIEETERIFGQVENAIRDIVPDSERAMILDNMGLTQSFTIMAYVDNGTVSNADGEIMVALNPKHRPTADYVA